MKKFLVLYRAPKSAMAKIDAQMAKATPAEAKAGMDAWMTWAKKNAKAIADLGAPLTGGASLDADGTLGAAAGRTGTYGYSILQGKSEKEIAKALAKCPHFKTPGATADIVEVVPLPGM